MKKCLLSRGSGNKDSSSGFNGGREGANMWEINSSSSDHSASTTASVVHNRLSHHGTPLRFKNRLHHKFPLIRVLQNKSKYWGVIGNLESLDSNLLK